ncbi:hypothetical protein AT261_00550 [Bacillus cereus]|uniref:hypothetical protein n=1 Tax=unclassified Bacillus (in: firmicutes) TaxID=185979 RepID=UPI00077ADA59|nr:hypothetical protein AT261_00550 [Bacillus cereus]HDR7990822.1 hypothetical protein [Bacillus cereus]
MNKKVGRRTKEYPEDEIRKIILRFTKENGISTEIPKRTLSEYTKKLFKEGELPWLDKEISDNYWVRSERKGFQIIEEYNNTVHGILKHEKDNEFKIPNIKNVLKNNCKDTEKLSQYLILFEKKLRLSIEKNNKFNEEIIQLKEKLVSQSQYIESLEKRIYMQEETIYRMFERGAISNPKIRGLNELGAESEEIIKIAMENMFNLSADEFLRIASKENINLENRQNKKLKPYKKSLLDDFRTL